MSSVKGLCKKKYLFIVIFREIYSNGSEPYVFLPSDITKYLEYIDNGIHLLISRKQLSIDR